MLAEKMQVKDHEAVRRLHDEMGFDYKMPDLASPLFPIKRLVRDKHGHVIGAAGLRLQAETYLWLDTRLSPVVRWKVISTLSHALFEAAWRVGLDSLVAYLPPGIPKSFHKALSWLGFSPAREGWQPFSKDIR